MLTILTVLKSGGVYTAEWVAKMSRSLERVMTTPYKLVCLSDVDVPCERIPLTEDWPGWWAKIAMFRPRLIHGPTLYLDLDNVILQDLAPLMQPQHDFAMLKNFHRTNYASSSVMWFKKAAPHAVYTKFKANPMGWIHHHEVKRDGPYLGDQAFVWECFGRDVPLIDTTKKAVLSYKVHVLPLGRVPKGTVMVAFGGAHKPHAITDEWLLKAWA